MSNPSTIPTTASGPDAEERLLQYYIRRAASVSHSNFGSYNADVAPPPISPSSNGNSTTKQITLSSDQVPGSITSTDTISTDTSTTISAISVGSATSTTPIVITTIQQLDSIGIDPSMPLSGSYVLGNNIDASGFAFVPIGSENAGFDGTFDGNGYAIKNLTITSSYSSVGLFALIDTGIIRNLTLIDETVTGENSFVGGIAGTNNGTITNSAVRSGSISAQGTPSGPTPEVGGLVGSNSGTIVDSYDGAAVGVNSTVTVSSSGNVNTGYVGGLAGYNRWMITGSSANGAISATGGDRNFVGGLVGFNTIYNAGALPNLISQSYATGDVTGGDYSWVGGLIGISYSLVDQSYATGSVSAGVSSNVGGLVGSAHFGSIIEQSFATGAATAGPDSNVGGLVGWNTEGTILNSYALGSIIGGSVRNSV